MDHRHDDLPGDQAAKHQHEHEHLDGIAHKHVHGHVDHDHRHEHDDDAEDLPQGHDAPAPDGKAR